MRSVILVGHHHLSYSFFHCCIRLLVSVPVLTLRPTHRCVHLHKVLLLFCDNGLVYLYSEARRYCVYAQVHPHCL